MAAGRRFARVVRAAIALVGIASMAIGWGACANRGMDPPPLRPRFVDDAAFLTADPVPDSSDSSSDPVTVADAGDGTDSSPSLDGAFDGDDDAAIAPDGAGDVPDGACADPLGPGQLIVDELMIESVAGSGDDGEWVEIANAADCAVNLHGLHVESPHAAKVATLDISDDVWIPAGGRFVVADSTVPATNHYLPGLVYGWYGHPGDVLRNMGGTVTLLVNQRVVDSVTYPAQHTAVGVSMAFPATCDAGERSDWTRWQPSTASFFPGFLGTPNAPNVDVFCP
jgi:hypothetical protein